MKTIQELYNEVMANEELKAQFIEAADAEKLEALLKENGCEATVEQVVSYLKAKEEEEDAPLSLDELENSAGGECNGSTAGETILSVCFLGTVCATIAIASQAQGGYAGQKKEGDGRLCN